MTQVTTLRPAPAGPVGGTPDPPAEASGRRARLVGVDATRGVALLGMIAMQALHELDGAGRPTSWFGILNGRIAATFAVLAGVGIAFLTGRRRVRLAAGPATVAALAIRALVILLVGLALGYTSVSLGPVILPYYALMFVLAIPLVFLPTWTVAVIGVALAAGMPALTHVLLPHLPIPTSKNATVGLVFERPVDVLSELAITGRYPALPWLAYLCAGLVIGRLALTTLRVATALCFIGTVLAVAAPIASTILLDRLGGRAHIWAAQRGSVLTAPETTELLMRGGDGTVPTSTWWWLAVDAPHTGTPLDRLDTAGIAIALLGIMLLAGQLAYPAVRTLAAVVQAPLAAAGSMTLTLYTAHILFISSGYHVYSATTGFLVQAVAVLLIGLALRATVGRGPLEGLITMLTARAWRGARSDHPERRPRVPKPRKPPAAESTSGVETWAIWSPDGDKVINQSEASRNVPRAGTG